MIDLRPHNDPARLIEEAKDWAAECFQLREENARLREAVEKARMTFNRYGDLHAAKPDEAKAARNYELADEMDRALNKDTTND